MWATSKHDVYLMSHFSVMHWSSLTCTKSEVLNVSGHVAPCEVSNLFFWHLLLVSGYMRVCVCFPGVVPGSNLFILSYLMQKHPGSLLEGFTQTQVSTLAVKDKLLVAGGFQGELICKVCIFIQFNILANSFVFGLC